MSASLPPFRRSAPSSAASIIGYGPFHVGIVSGLLHAIVTYVLGLVGVFVLAYVIDFLAGVFRRAKESRQRHESGGLCADRGLGLPAFSALFRRSRFLGILGLYSLYLLHTGIAALMKPPADKALIYTIVVVVVVIVVWFVVFGILGALFGLGDDGPRIDHGSAFKCRIGRPGAIACAAATIELASMP